MCTNPGHIAESHSKRGNLILRRFGGAVVRSTCWELINCILDVVRLCFSATYNFQHSILCNFSVPDNHCTSPVSAFVIIIIIIIVYSQLLFLLFPPHILKFFSLEVGGFNFIILEMIFFFIKIIKNIYKK